MLDIDAQSLDGVANDPSYIDSIVTLYDADGVQIAQNDDPIFDPTPDARLYTILPADGPYCVRVAECWTVASNPASDCVDPEDKVHTDYRLFYRDFNDMANDEYTADQEMGDDAATAGIIGYKGTGNNTYYSSNVWGTFRDDVDVDVFRFTIPADLAVPVGRRAMGRFFILPSGKDESGSTTPTGAVYVVDPTTSVRVAEVDATKVTLLGSPFELGKEYLLYVTRPAGVVGLNDFYFVRHQPSWGNLVETEVAGGATNDTVATAEALTPESSGTRFYFEGDLMPYNEADHFIAAAPTGTTRVGVGCASWSFGSGLRDLTVSLLKSTGEPLAAAASGVESETEPASVGWLQLNGAAQVVVEIEATLKDPAVSSTYYYCVLQFAA